MQRWGHTLVRVNNVHAKASGTRGDSNKCLLSPLGESPRGLVIGAVMGVGNNVRRAFLTAPFTLSLPL
jgi:hypothetical protein